MSHANGYTDEVKNAGLDAWPGTAVTPRPQTSEARPLRLRSTPVHGLIFASFRDYLLTEHGSDVAHEVTAGEPQYTLSEAYPDEQFLALLERACARTGLAREEILFEFGTFTAAVTFARLYSVLFRASATARDFLLTVETPIHQVVREALPEARPPELAVTDLGDDGLGIVYASPRRVCAMLRGLVEGTGRVYGEALEVEELECMLEGAEACRFVVRFDGDREA